MLGNPRRVAALVAAALLFGVGCGNSEHPPAYQRRVVTTEPDDAGTAIQIEGYDASVPPPEDMTGLCGNQILRPVLARPNLYLVLDRSGSMADPFQDPVKKSWIEKWKGACQSVHAVLYSLGHRLAYGAAVFPQFGVIDSCAPGAEIDKMAAGDSVTYARSGLIGPHLKKLTSLLGRYVPEGSTPTSATLNELVEPLIALGTNTTVILATDGAPNCNENAACDIAHCMANIEGTTLSNGTLCDSRINCCDPSIVWGPLNCIDVDATLQPIARLFANGIRTYVIGLPGSEAHDDVLNRLAAAGGTARGIAASTAPAGTATEPLYYPVTDTEQLTTALRGITAALSISCTIPLEKAPPDWSQVNVYFDNSVIKRNPNDGWRQLDANTLEITGTMCDLLRSGDVYQVQIVAGCPTEELI